MGRILFLCDGFRKTDLGIDLEGRYKTQGHFYGGTKVTWKIYFILRAHAVANTCARNN